MLDKKVIINKKYTIIKLPISEVWDKYKRKNGKLKNL